MKKLFLFLVLLFSLYGCGNNIDQVTADYCVLVNEQIKEYDFSTAKIEPEKIVLYDEKMSVLKKINFPSYNKNMNILYIEKYENKIHFAVSGWLDDSSGFMIVNSEGNFSDITEGVYSIERYKNNIYKYKTYP